jgi:tRNA(Ile)-lysidine synthase
VIKFEKKVSAFISDERLLADRKKVLLAVSGGLDSVALVAVMSKLADIQIVIAHVNHNLRGKQSDADQQFVSDLAEKLGIKMVIESVDVTGFAERNALSIETAARQLRTEAMCRSASKTGCDAIATGHHKDDNAETIVHRLMRGTGFKGLGGIKPERILNGTVFISPMLCVRRKEIEDYAKQNQLKWRQDHTNEDCTITRNKIRHLLLGELKKTYKGELADDLEMLSEKCRRLYEKIERQVESLDAMRKGPTAVSIAIDKLNAQHKLVQVEIVRQALEAAGCGLRDITAEHYDRVIGLCHGAGGRKIQLPGGFVAIREHKKIILKNPKSEIRSPKQNLNSNVQNSKRLPTDGCVEFDGHRITTKVLNASDCDVAEFIKNKNAFVEWFDLDRISGDIVVRRRKEGDKFWPIGLGTEKKVGKFITAEKIGEDLRESLVVVADSKKILWLCPIRASEITRVTCKTKKILQISVRQAV